MKEKIVFKKISISVCLLLLSLYSTAQDDFYKKLSDAAIAIIDPTVRYVPDYVKIPYPGGDVPAKTGVCTDVVIRAYRKLGIDLQEEVHKDMKANFSVYPNSWGLKQTDTNIDHRRVPNLMKFFSRHGQELPVSSNKDEYKPGDIVCWLLPNNRTHIGIVVDKKTLFEGRYKVVHNISNGQVLEDCLFNYKIIGHYRYKK